jgi:hypothetical protein
MRTLYRGLPIDASNHVSDHLAKRFQRRRIKKISQGSIYGKSSYKDCSFCPNLLTNMATTDNSFFLIGQFLKIFYSDTAWPNRPKASMDRDRMSNLYRGPSIDASYQVSVHLAMWFLRRKYLEIDQSETRIACGGHVLFLIC